MTWLGWTTGSGETKKPPATAASSLFGTTVSLAGNAPASFHAALEIQPFQPLWIMAR
jgi:hypothetical protein